MDDAALQVAADRLIWFHSLELRPGVVTRGRKSQALLADEAEAMLGPLDLAGRSVLDIGAWNGLFSIEAHRRGAARVVACDQFAWHHPSLRGWEGFQLARACLAPGIEAIEIDVQQLTPAIGRFDLALFLGIFYHLFDPLQMFRRLHGLVREVLVVETHQDMLEVDRPAMAFYPGTELLGDATSWWGPNPPLVAALLREAGFCRVLHRDHPRHGRDRGIYLALAHPQTPVLRRVGPAWREI